MAFVQCAQQDEAIIQPIMREENVIVWKPELLSLVILVSGSNKHKIGFRACKSSVEASLSQAHCHCVASVKCGNFGSPPTDYLGM